MRLSTHYLNQSETPSGRTSQGQLVISVQPTRLLVQTRLNEDEPIFTRLFGTVQQIHHSLSSAACLNRRGQIIKQHYFFDGSQLSQL